MKKKFPSIEKLSEMLSSFCVCHENITVQPQYDNITKAITTSLRSAHAMRKEYKRHKLLSERTTYLLQRRKELQKKKQKCESRSMKNDLSVLSKIVNKYEMTMQIIDLIL